MAIMEAVYYKTSVAAIRALGPYVTLKDMKGHKLCENDDEMAEWITPYPSEKDLQESSEKMAATFTWDRCADAFYRHLLKKQQVKPEQYLPVWEKQSIISFRDVLAWI